jgi:hypothetical protein
MLGKDSAGDPRRDRRRIESAQPDPRRVVFDAFRRGLRIQACVKYNVFLRSYYVTIHIAEAAFGRACRRGRVRRMVWRSRDAVGSIDCMRDVERGARITTTGGNRGLSGRRGSAIRPRDPDRRPPCGARRPARAIRPDREPASAVGARSAFPADRVENGLSCCTRPASRRRTPARLRRRLDRPRDRAGRLLFELAIHRSGAARPASVTGMPSYVALHDPDAH